MQQKKNLIIKIAIIIAGIIGGYLYWYYIGCLSGTCPINSKWYWSSLYGGVLGFLIGSIFTRFKKTEPEEDRNIQS